MDTTGQSFVEATDFFGRAVRATNFVLDYWWLWLLIAFFVWVAFRLRAHHALLAQLDERADAAFGDADALLVERRALIGNLVQVVRAFTKHERGVIGDVLEGRIEALEALGDGVAIHADAQVAASLNNLFSVAENYPQLTSEGHYRTLRQDLIRVEERITAARKFYNLAVEESNSVRRAFPGFLLAAGTPTREKFQIGGEKRSELSEPLQIDL
jgi:LemA protein